MHALRSLNALIAEVVSTAPWRAAACVALMAALGLAEGAGLLLLMPLLELVGVDDPTTMPTVARWVDAGFAAVGMERTLGGVLALFVAVTGARTLLQRWQVDAGALVRERFTSRLRTRVYRAISRAEWAYLVTRRPSEFTHVLVAEVGRLGGAVTQVLDVAVLAVVSAVYLALAFRFSAVMSALVLVTAAVLAWGVRGRLERARASGARAAQARSRLHHAVAEHIHGLKTARSYGAVGRHEAAFARVSDELHDVSLELNAGETGLQQSLELGSTVVLAVIVYVSAAVVGVPAAQLLVLLYIFARLMPRLVTISRQAQRLAQALPVFERVIAVERECREAAEPAHGGDEPIALARAIRFEGVWFAYRRRLDAPALRDIDLEIPAGRTTAIVGPSGAGKSTLADLLMGLLSPTAGRILVDDVPLAGPRVAAWRGLVSYVPQDAYLFHDTVRANLLWARPEAAEAELWHALGLAAADAFVRALPQGLDTVIGERGVLVSGGERQRLALARALVRRPAVLILDEATSALDSENERRIQQAVDALQHRMTIVVITHRLSTIRNADIVHVLDDGQLAGSGNWPDLLRPGGGRFHQLWVAQGLDGAPGGPASALEPVAGHDR